QFVGMLLRKKSGATPRGLDLDGFLVQIEQVLTEWLRRSSEAPEQSVTLPGHFRLGDETRRVSAAARDRIATVATAIFVEQLRATGRSHERLRDIWNALVREIGDMDLDAAAPLLARHASAATDLARALDKSVEVEVSAVNLRLREDVLDAVGTVTLHAMRNA